MVGPRAGSRLGFPKPVIPSLSRNRYGSLRPACGEIKPLGIHLLDKLDFLGAIPLLQLSFTRDGCVHFGKTFVVNQAIQSIFLGPAGVFPLAMFPQANFQVSCDADVDGAIGVGQDVDRGLDGHLKLIYCGYRFLDKLGMTDC